MTKNTVNRIQQYVVTTTFILLMSTLLSHSAAAAINQAFTYQGKIVNTDGTNLTNSNAACVATAGADTCDVRVSLYTASTGGTLVWQETKSNLELYDNNGIFNLVLDCGGTFSTCNQNGGPDFTSGQLYIEVEFDPSGNEDFAEGETFDPRREMTAVPYSFNAATADSAGALDGIDSASFLRSDTSDTFASGHTLTVAGTLDVDGNIEIDGDLTISDQAIVFDSPSTEFTLTGDLSINTNDLFVEKSSGYVGIGTTNPQVELDLLGSLRATSNLDVEGYAVFGNGSALSSNSGLIVDYDAIFTGIGQQLLVQGNVTGAASTNVYGARISPEGITIPTGTTNLAASLYISEPAITETGTLTNSASLYISGAATEADNNFALWIDSGNVQIDEDLTVSNNIVLGNNLIIGGTSQATADIFFGSDGTLIVNEQGNNSDFRVDGSGPNLSSILFADANTGRIGIGTSSPTAYLDLPSSITTAASLRLRTGTAPSSPNIGDIYSDGTGVFFRGSSGWLDLSAAGTLQSSYEAGNSISATSGEGAISFDLASANFDIEVGQGTDTGDFRIWNGTYDWLLVDENTSAVNIGNTNASTTLSLASGTGWSIASTGAVAGVTTLNTSGDWTWNASTPAIGINTGEALTITDGTDSFIVNTTASSLTFSDGSNGYTFDLDSGPSYTGNARPVKKITLSPEYSGAVLTSFYGAGTDTNITGTMISDADTAPATNIRSYYSWERSASTQHFYTVAVRVKLPQDFATWTTSNAVVVNYQTENATSTNSSVDARIYLEGNATVDATSSGLASTSWTTTSFTAANLDLWNAAGETAVIYLRLGSQSGNYARVGDIELNYNASY